MTAVKDDTEERKRLMKVKIGQEIKQQDHGN